MGDPIAQAEELKIKGNEALKEGHVDEAVKCYSEALELQPDNQFLLSNRCAANCKAGRIDEAMIDAEKTIEVAPDWAKGYSRKGAVLAFLNRHEESLMAYMEALDRDPTSDSIKAAVTKEKSFLTGPGESQPLVTPFADRNIWDKIMADSRTREYMQDPEYVEMIKQLQKNPKDLGKFMSDSRLMTTLGVLLGVQLEMSENGAPPGFGSESMPPPFQFTKADEAKNSAAAPPPPITTALKEKEAGNAAYKKKDFETALSHYNKALELEPTNIVFRNNKAAVYFEREEYETCIQECEEAVSVGRENRADFKIISKAMSRMGNAYHKMGNLDQALVCYRQSVSEHRDQSMVKKVNEVQKEIKERDRLASLNPDKSLEEKQLGNSFFTSGDYPSAIKHYTEAIKHNPKDAKLYSNRAASYTKLLEFNMALRDSEDCISLDPAFVKGYLRKAASLFAMKDVGKAGDAFQKAMDLDPNCQEAIDGYRKCVVQDTDPEAVRRRAMQNPEVQQILQDPAMQLILQQMQKDPHALQEHLKNPEVAKKIEKLLEVGLIAIR